VPFAGRRELRQGPSALIAYYADSLVAPSVWEAGIWNSGFPPPQYVPAKMAAHRGRGDAVQGTVLVDSEALLTENEACMQASQRLRRFPPAVHSVTNSVTNGPGNGGQCRAIVTNSVTKLRAIQGNEITRFGESRAMEGN